MQRQTADITAELLLATVILPESLANARLMGSHALGIEHISRGGYSWKEAARLRLSPGVVTLVSRSSLCL